jgi:multicomponent Na+:H+ antiporter subunit E
MKAKLATFVIMLSFWVILSGMFDAFHLTLGVISCLLVSHFSGKMLFEGLRIGVRTRQIFGMLAYCPWLLWAIVLSSLQVAYIVLHPQMLDKMEPQLIRFKTKLKSNFARVTFAQSITLTPGTITVSMQDNEMTVYALTRSAAEGLPGEMERRIARALEPEGA